MSSAAFAVAISLAALLAASVECHHRGWYVTRELTLNDTRVDFQVFIEGANDAAEVEGSSVTNNAYYTAFRSSAAVNGLQLAELGKPARIGVDRLPFVTDGQPFGGYIIIYPKPRSHSCAPDFYEISFAVIPEVKAVIALGQNVESSLKCVYRDDGAESVVSVACKM